MLKFIDFGINSLILTLNVPIYWSITFMISTCFNIYRSCTQTEFGVKTTIKTQNDALTSDVRIEMIKQNNPLLLNWSFRYYYVTLILYGKEQHGKTYTHFLSGVYLYKTCECGVDPVRHTQTRNMCGYHQLEMEKYKFLCNFESKLKQTHTGLERYTTLSLGKVSNDDDETTQ